MSKNLTRQQQTHLDNFLNCAPLVSEENAIKLLVKNRWKVDASLDDYFSNPLKYNKEDPFRHELVQEIFLQYRDMGASRSVMSDDNLYKFLADLGITDDDEIGQFIVAWKLGASSISGFTEEEFIRGMEKVRCDSLEKVKMKLPEWRNELNDQKAFGEFYGFLFKYAKGTGVGKRGLIIEEAKMLWSLLIADKFIYYDIFMRYLGTIKSQINMDIWDQTLEFVYQTQKDPSLSWYSDESSWPIFFDEFVEFWKQEKAQ